jgi:hypothetical protein
MLCGQLVYLDLFVVFDCAKADNHSQAGVRITAAVFKSRSCYDFTNEKERYFTPVSMIEFATLNYPYLGESNALYSSKSARQ